MNSEDSPGLSSCDRVLVRCNPQIQRPGENPPGMPSPAESKKSENLGHPRSWRFRRWDAYSAPAREPQRQDQTSEAKLSENMITTQNQERERIAAKSAVAPALDKQASQPGEPEARPAGEPGARRRVPAAAPAAVAVTEKPARRRGEEIRRLVLLLRPSSLRARCLVAVRNDSPCRPGARTRVRRTERLAFFPSIILCGIIRVHQRSSAAAVRNTQSGRFVGG